MMFKFSFQSSNTQDGSQKGVSAPQEQRANGIEWMASERVEVLPSHLELMLSLQGSVVRTTILNLSVAHLSTECVVSCIKNKSHDDNRIKLAEDLHSDLVPAKYEGGLKIWEGTIDLLECLLCKYPDASLKGKYVLDLGCGAGLLGIAALKRGANVVFQDYNKEVLESCTIPNVLLNLADEDAHKLIESKAQNNACYEFYCGDWSSFPSKLCEGKDKPKFDLILTSETIYNPDNHKKLCNVFKECLKDTGSVYLAAKTYYFGVGGGLRQFETVLQEDGTLKSEVHWRCSSGLSREILKIEFVS